MIKCINVNNKEFKDLVEKSGLNSIQLEARMNKWMTENNSDEWPSLSQLGVDVEIVEDANDADEKEKIVDDSEKTITVNEIYSPMSNYGIETSEESVPELSIEDDFFREDSYEAEEKALDDNERKPIKAVPYSNLTSTLVYQYRDVSAELATVKGQMVNASKAEFKRLSAEAGVLKDRLNVLSKKIKEAKELDNMWQVVDFGNQAIAEATKILDDGELTVKGLNYAKRLVKFWSKVGSEDKLPFGHILFGDSYYAGVDDNVVNELKNISSKMSAINRGLLEFKQKLLIRNMVRDVLDDRYSDEQIYAAMRDINWASANLFAISDINSPLITAIYTAMKKVDSESALEIDATMKLFDAKLKAADKFLPSKGQNKYDLYYQSQNSQLTGDLVKMYSKDYNDTKNALIKKAKALRSKTNWNEFREWSKENEDYVDIRLLFPEYELSEIQQKLADEHKAMLISAIGEKQYERMINQLEVAIDNYKYEKMAVENRLYSDPSNSEQDIVELLRIFEYEQSPYIELDRRFGRINTDGTISEFESTIGGVKVFAKNGIKGLRSIPKKTINGKPSGWYDEKYLKIAEHEETLDLYNFIYDTMEYMRSILPEYQRSHIGSNAMPYIRKSVIETLTDGVTPAIGKLVEQLQKSVLISDVHETEFDEIDIETGKTKAGIKVNSFMRTDKHIRDAVKIKIIAYEANSGIKATPADIERFKREVIDESNKERSFDLPTVLKAYMATMITHKHKLNTIDLIEVGRSAFNDINELSLSTAGAEQKTPEGLKRQQLGLNRIEELLDYTINHFKNQPIHEKQGKVSDKKKYTYVEKTRIAELVHTKELLDMQFKNGTIEQADYDIRVKAIDDEMNKLGGYAYLSKYGDNLLKYVQLKGMGFNVIAGGVNLMTGYMENSIKAADGRYYDQAQLHQAVRDAYSTVYDPRRSNPTTKKLIGIEKRFRLVSDASQELYRQEGKLTDIAYIITKKTEFINIMSMAGAYFRNIPVTDDQGNKSNLYEAFDENGSIKDGWILDDKLSNEKFLFNVDMAIHRLIQKSHGNYSDPMMFKKHIFGRMAMQFRTWMPEMFNSR